MAWGRFGLSVGGLKVCDANLPRIFATGEVYRTLAGRN
jgi:hypothetical protein